MTTIRTVGVIGAGQMGIGIAQVYAASGFETLLWDAAPKAAQNGVEKMKTQLSALVEKQKITKEEEERTVANLKTCSELSEFSRCDLAIEAIVEKAEVKEQLFKQLDALLPPASYIATNTSSISITRLARATSRPSQVMGLHFMNPVPLMKLVELIRGLQTSDETYNTLRGTIDALGKTAVLAIDSPGFIVNRILCPMVNEAIYLLQEGVKAEDIDAAMKLGTNQPMGPLLLADFVGLDTLHSILQILHRELGEDKYRPCPLLTKYVEAGWYGKKVGRGFYKYP